MNGWGSAIAVVDVVAREAMLFAAIGFLIGGLDDLAIDLLYLVHRMRQRLGGATRRPTLADFPVAVGAQRIAVFVAAWDESAVIGAMLRTALGRFDVAGQKLWPIIRTLTLPERRMPITRQQSATNARTGFF